MLSFFIILAVTMKKDSIYLAYLQRAIHANGNAFKSKDEIFNSLDPKIDRQEFENYFSTLNSRGVLEEHLLTGKWKLNSAGDVGMILLNQQENQERLRKERLPIKNPHKLQLIQPIKRGTLSIWKLMNENIIATVVGGYLLYQLIKHL
jgi:hypothetical protein